MNNIFDRKKKDTSQSIVYKVQKVEYVKIVYKKKLKQKKVTKMSPNFYILVRIKNPV